METFLGGSSFNAYPIGSVYFTTIADLNPSTLFGGTWELIGSKLAVRENVFGNGKTLGLTDGSNKVAFISRMVNSMASCALYLNGFGSNVGASATGDNIVTNKYIGVPTKSQLGSNPEYSGLIVDTETIYSWKRTA